MAVAAARVASTVVAVPIRTGMRRAWGLTATAATPRDRGRRRRDYEMRDGAVVIRVHVLHLGHGRPCWGREGFRARCSLGL